MGQRAIVVGAGMGGLAAAAALAGFFDSVLVIDRDELPDATVPRAGERDLVLRFRVSDQLLAALPAAVPQLRPTLILPGCGHWTQQERPEAVNAAMLGFLQSLKGAEAPPSGRNAEPGQCSG